MEYIDWLLNGLLSILTGLIIVLLIFFNIFPNDFIKGINLNLIFLLGWILFNQVNVWEGEK